MLWLTLLAPQLVEAITEGRQRVGVDVCTPKMGGPGGGGPAD
jgi:hypothetical protein